MGRPGRQPFSISCVPALSRAAPRWPLPTVRWMQHGGSATHVDSGIGALRSCLASERSSLGLLLTTFTPSFSLVQSMEPFFFYFINNCTLFLLSSNCRQSKAICSDGWPSDNESRALLAKRVVLASCSMWMDPFAEATRCIAAIHGFQAQRPHRRVTPRATRVLLEIERPAGAAARNLDRPRLLVF